MHPVEHGDMRKVFKAIKGFGQTAIDDDLRNSIAELPPRWLLNLILNEANRFQVHTHRLGFSFSPFPHHRNNPSQKPFYLALPFL